MPLLSRRKSGLDLLNSNADHHHHHHESRPRQNPTTLRPDSPTTPRPVSEYGRPPSRLSRQFRPEEVADVQDGPPPNKTNRFSMMKRMNFSEPQLAARARQDAATDKENRPPMPTLPSADGRVPSIVRTAPTMEHGSNDQETEGSAAQHSLLKRSLSKSRSSEHHPPSPRAEDSRRPSKGRTSRWRKIQGRSSGLEDLARLSTLHASSSDNQIAPPSYGDESQSALALPVTDPRMSDSSRSDGSNASSGDHIYGQTTTTTHTVSTHTTFFRLPRRNKNRNSLFPLPVKFSPPDEQQTPKRNEPETPRASVSGRSAKSLQTSGRQSPHGAALQRRHTEASPTKQRDEVPALPSPNTLFAKGALSFAESGMNLFRNESQRSQGSANSSPLQPPMRLGMRDRASTTSSFGRTSHDIDTPPTMNGSARNSTSTTGRSSLGGFLNFARFRNSSDPHSPRHSPGTRSKSNSFAMSREALVVPEREEGDTPGRYLERLEAAVTRSMIAGILSKSADPFAQAVLRSYTRRFPFFGEPIDMSLRKFLLEAELPKETQQVDRVIQAFADRYNECNPGIFPTADQAYVLAFSLMMLHTDAFNKNNKRKMTRQDYIKNTSGQGVADEVLGCLYDNICYTPFVHYEEEVDMNGERVMPFKPSRKSKLKGTIHETTGKKPTGPVDPYNLLVEQKLDLLRPSVKESITFDDPYNYRGNQELDPQYLQGAFTHTGILQIISARSRPTAYEGQLTNNAPGPSESQAGIIDLKITKVGVLWRKSAKKKKTRSPWQEWGAILTGSQLYLFKNAHWAKGLLQQFASQQKPGQSRTPVIFKPPLTEFKPDALIKTDNAVALLDASYNRHKHAFTFFRAGGHEEVLLADNEAERNDWLALINYAAAFRAAGVRIRGMVGGNEEDLRRRDVQRLESSRSTRSLQTPEGEVTVMRGGLNPQLQRQVMAARRQIMVQKIAEIEKEMGEANQRLDGMLRNGRHLLVLAPIAPKARDDVLHAAAKTDANIRWVRRDVWRMRAHKDILALDVQQDGVSASELQALTNQQHSAPSTAKKDPKENGPSLSRINSKASAEPARSPPQSPTTSTRPGGDDRPSTTESMDTFMGNDVFRTPPESAKAQNGNDYWRLPPLQLDVQQNQDHRTSVSHSTLSVSSPGRGSLSHASSTSSINRIDSMPSPRPSEKPSQPNPLTPTTTMEKSQVERLARSTTTPDTILPAAKDTGLDGTPQGTTSENKRKSARRSLQKTLRDAHHHRQSSIHRHRRNKDSESTVRSNGDNIATGSDDLPESTPGLQREKGRFILHGKQASVIQFGDDWPNERMKLRREMWRQNSLQSSTSYASSPPQSEDGASTVGRGWRKDSEVSNATASLLASPSTTARDVRVGADISESSEAESEAGPAAAAAPANGADDVFSATQAENAALREDAEAAEAFTATSASPTRLSSTASSEGGDDDDDGETPAFFDAAQWNWKDASNGPAAGTGTSKRQTVIGPTSSASSPSHHHHKHHRRMSLQKGDGGNIESADDHYEEDDDGSPAALGPKSHRRTVLGPAPSIKVNGSEAIPSNEPAGLGISSTEEGDEDEDDDKHRRRISESTTAGGAGGDSSPSSSASSEEEGKEKGTPPATSTAASTTAAAVPVASS
ncbi:hypothetical protein D0869_12072 [Hortaea werneckii]|uniref:SEC7 domain-containing protein n=2 Tax=Hortaea werneckii TaxID=91943 RepID=A0A3M6W8T8_HORWE|nr:hypothetical protein KC324_g5197 [Hortaea werneckii]KAI7583566.1 hypothetical protein KC316_g7194 [Hortaea werneckii]RMX74967.1 hypothetical protein D0869_12072 [Hortaea werneckii]